MSKFTLHTLPQNNGPFNCRPAGKHELEDEKILANNIIFPGEFNPHNIRLWVIGNEFGALGAVWASCEQDALDELVDAGLGDGLLIDEVDADEDTTRLGNDGDAADLTHAWLGQVEFKPERDIKVMLALAHASGASRDNLG